MSTLIWPKPDKCFHLGQLCEHVRVVCLEPGAVFGHRFEAVTQPGWDAVASNTIVGGGGVGREFPERMTICLVNRINPDLGCERGVGMQACTSLQGAGVLNKVFYLAHLN